MGFKICVVGAGVVGLTTAVRLKETQGFFCDVTIKAKGFGKDTTSHVAAGVFRFRGPIKVSGYKGKRMTVERDIMSLSYNEWKTTLEAKEGDKAGIHKLEGYEISYPGVLSPEQVPNYTEYLHKWCKLSDTEVVSKFPTLPKGCSGCYVETVLISPKTYMDWLMRRFQEMGGKIEKNTVCSFDELFEDYDVVINCTGLNATALTGDTTLYPVRGQVIRARLPGSKNTFAAFNTGTDRTPYYYWTPDGTVLGGIRDENNANLSISQEDDDTIMSWCGKYFPWLGVTEAKVIRREVGLRPSRSSIRLESERCFYKGKNKWVIHNYGHGAYGICISWGTACIAVEMVLDIVHQSKL